MKDTYVVRLVNYDKKVAVYIETEYTDMDKAIESTRNNKEYPEEAGWEWDAAYPKSVYERMKEL